MRVSGENWKNLRQSLPNEIFTVNRVSYVYKIHTDFMSVESEKYMCALCHVSSQQCVNKIPLCWLHQKMMRLAIDRRKALQTYDYVMIIYERFVNAVKRSRCKPRFELSFSKSFWSIFNIGRGLSYGVKKFELRIQFILSFSLACGPPCQAVLFQIVFCFRYRNRLHGKRNSEAHSKLNNIFLIWIKNFFE